ncbi:MAG: glycosyl hydrolase family 18 protein [Candidatus Omnitrophota bacterium]
MTLKPFKNFFLIVWTAAFLILGTLPANVSSDVSTAETYEPASSPLSFKETWGYLMQGEEYFVHDDMPFSDILYFSARVGDNGRIPTDIRPPDLSSRLNRTPKFHIVISMIGSKMLTNFMLRKDLPFREQLIKDIASYAEYFDGIQLDFESVRYEDRQLYVSLLEDLRSRLPKEILFSVAVPARWWENLNAYEYPKIAEHVDRVMIMAYDEHWRTGEPGPIASLPWCEKILHYAQKRIPADKLIMGLPLYGRAWQTETFARALKHPQTLELCENQTCTIKLTETGDPYFEYTETARLKVHFEDQQSLANKLKFYQENRVKGVAFWRIGQEPAAIWDRF